nr:ionotropic glutamate receptor, metazoa [Tanacetum cinerariifolium]
MFVRVRSDLRSIMLISIYRYLTSELVSALTARKETNGTSYNAHNKRWNQELIDGRVDICSAAAMYHFLFKELLLDRHSLSSQLKQQFDSLDSRVSSLDSPPPPPSLSNQV